MERDRRIRINISLDVKTMKEASQIFHDLTEREGVVAVGMPVLPVESLEPTIVGGAIHPPVEALPVETPHRPALEEADGAPVSPPVEPTAIAGVTTPIETVGGVSTGLDSEGVPWCPDIHSASRATLSKDGPSGKAGSFKLKKGLKQKMTPEQINQKKDELKASVAAAPPVETPPVAAPPVETPPVATPPVETPPVATPPVTPAPTATSVAIPPGVDPAYFALMKKCTPRITAGELTMEEMLIAIQNVGAINGVTLSQVAELNKYPALVPMAADGIEAVWKQKTQK